MAIKRPPIKTMRRLALAATVVMIAVVSATYLTRRYRAQEARRAAERPVAGDVQQQAEAFTFSRSQEGQTLFTVEASRTTERTGKTTLLEDVVVRIYGQRGERNDEIRTARCEYDAGGSERIVCPGEVNVLLRQARAADPQEAILLTTTALQFDPNESVAWTDEPVRFTFPGGRGQAIGLRYQQSEPRIQFRQEIHVEAEGAKSEPVRIDGTGLAYNTGERVFTLAPPLRVALGDRTLMAASLQMALDERFRTRRLEAGGGVEVVLPQDGRSLTMRATRAVAEYNAAGDLERLRANRQVNFKGRGPRSSEHLTSEEAVFHFDPSQQSLSRLVATGSPLLTVETPAGRHTLRAPEIEFDFHGSRQLLFARRRGSLGVERRSGEHYGVTANELRLELGPAQQLRSLAASGKVETSTRQSEGRAWTTSSEELRARFDEQGELSAAEQSGRFRYQDARWQAEAGRAEYAGAAEKIVLREQPVVSDADSRTTAQRIEVVLSSGELSADGDVRTTGRAGAAGGFGSGEPVQLAADRLTASQREGTARYQGRARLWQGDNRLAASAIDLAGKPARLVATGDVSTLFLEASSTETPARAQRAVRIASRRFTYDAAERRAVFSEGVTARNDFGTLTAPRLEAFLSPGNAAAAARLERVHAAGGVLIKQGDQEASSEQGEYRADAQTVVLWGGAPAIHDASSGTVATGARLTLFLADGTLSIDSTEGTRTVTRRPWAQ